MSSTFPLSMVGWVRCTVDGEALALADGTTVDGAGVRDGELQCAKCRARYSVTAGILDLFGASRPEGESAREQQLRDADSGDWDPREARWDTPHDRMATIPTLDALDLGADTTVLEMGCGDGRYTTEMARTCRSILAVDFSLGSLRVLQRRLDGAANVGLVHADITSLRVSEGAFDRAFSTLTSNLPTPAHREALYRLAARSIGASGAFVHCTHHHGIRERLDGTPKSGLYKEGGIFRHNFTVGEALQEMRAHFRHATARPIQIYLPLAMKLKLPLVAQSRLAERLPLLNRFGLLLLCRATGPR